MKRGHDTALLPPTHRGDKGVTRADESLQNSAHLVKFTWSKEELLGAVDILIKLLSLLIVVWIVMNHNLELFDRDASRYYLVS